jgi:hypothetical protein
MIPDDKEPYDEEPTQNYPHHTEQTSNPPVSITKVEDDDGIEEKDLKRSFLFGDSNDKDPDNKGYESHGMGGQSFGEPNVTRSGDDAANTSQNAGYDNDYFKRTEPLEEHPENNNFKPAEQAGAANTNMEQGEKSQNDTGYREAPEQEKVGGGEPQVDSNTNPNGTGGQETQTGTADNDGTSGQKVDGELQTKGTGQITEDNQNDGKADYKPEDGHGPDYGSNSPEQEGSKVTGGE